MRLKKQYGVPCTMTPKRGQRGELLHYEATLFNYTGLGRTPDAAVHDLTMQIGRSSRSDQQIFAAQWRNYIFIANYNWEHQQWHVHRLGLHQDPEAFASGWLSGATTIATELTHPPTKDMLADLVRESLIKYGWKPADGLRIPCQLRTVNLPELARYLEFQLRYHNARERGLSDTDSRNYAGRNPITPELWVNEPKEELRLVQG